MTVGYVLLSMDIMENPGNNQGSAGGTRQKPETAHH